jgi:hypothetical protein
MNDQNKTDNQKAALQALPAKKVYEKPQIVYRAPLEARAGSVCTSTLVLGCPTPET